MSLTWTAKMNLDDAMDLAERFEKVTAYQIQSFSQSSDGTVTFTFSVFEPTGVEREVSETTSELEYTDIEDNDYDYQREDIDADYTYDHDESLVPFDPSSVCDIIGTCDGCGETTNVNAYHYCEYCWDDLTE